MFAYTIASLIALCCAQRAFKRLYETSQSDPHLQFIEQVCFCFEYVTVAELSFKVLDGHQAEHSAD